MPRYAVNQVITALRANHGLLVLAADELQCSRSTIYSYVQRYPDVAEVLAGERERLIDLAEQGLYYHLTERSPWAIALVLKTLGKGRGYEDKRPITEAPDNGDAQEWQAIQATLLAALQPYPEARFAVVRALRGQVDESANGHTPGA
jgi:hypothetical protein